MVPFALWRLQASIIACTAVAEDGIGEIPFIMVNNMIINAAMTTIISVAI
jgi:hypothetical protein